MYVTLPLSHTHTHTECYCNSGSDCVNNRCLLREQVVDQCSVEVVRRNGSYALQYLCLDGLLSCFSSPTQRKRTVCSSTNNHTLSHTHTRSLSLTHTLSHTHSLSLSHTHILSHTHSLSLSLSHTLTPTHSLSLTHTHTHTHIARSCCIGNSCNRCLVPPGTSYHMAVDLILPEGCPPLNITPPVTEPPTVSEDISTNERIGEWLTVCVREIAKLR